MNQINIDDYLFAIQQRNLVYNYNFLLFSNKESTNPITYNNPDGWFHSDPGGGNLSFDEGKLCCRILKSGDSSQMSFLQAVHEFPRWQQVLIGQQVSAVALVGAGGSKPCTIEFNIFDGQFSSNKSVTLQVGSTAEISVDLQINSQATELTLGVFCSDPDVVVEVYKVYANVGKVALETLPCMVDGYIGQRKQYVSTSYPPATELSLCRESVELPTGYSRLDSFLNGKFGYGISGTSKLPDMRGYFSRAWNNGSSVDPDANKRTALNDPSEEIGDVVGSLEEDCFKVHNHGLKYTNSGSLLIGDVSSTFVAFNPNPAQTDDAGGKETRSKNISELYTIKWA